jgi:hypothetical protein
MLRGVSGNASKKITMDRTSVDPSLSGKGAQYNKNNTHQYNKNNTHQYPTNNRRSPNQQKQHTPRQYNTNNTH